eukprot:843462-Rhodomonas_salina.1
MSGIGAAYGLVLPLRCWYWLSVWPTLSYAGPGADISYDDMRWYEMCGTEITYALGFPMGCA